MRFKVSENEHIKKHEKHEHTIDCQNKENKRLLGTNLFNLQSLKFLKKRGGG